MKHIDYPLVRKPQPARYQNHRFWTRKRANEGWEYVNAYSKESDVVPDPFSGSGVYPLEAVRIGRKAVGGSISVRCYIYRVRNNSAPVADKKD